ncbi:MAG TPA: TniQ family protein [Ktedonobacteraceae bacterium]
MQTVQQMNWEHPLWRTLPLHPQPKPLESLNGYILRLAEANGLKSVHELARLSGLRKGWRDQDSSSIPTGRLAGIARCDPNHLQNMTCYHLARHFACAGFSVESTSPFFRGSLASSLRYCPACLDDQPYYRLTWRFLALRGCVSHGCSLLNTCGHCLTPISLLARRPRIACCPACQGDLRTCSTSPLPQQARETLEKHARDLELLLMPAELAPEITSALLQGSGFFLLRVRRQMGFAEAARLMGTDEQALEEIEEGNWGRKATLADYWRYTEILDCSLSDVIEAAQIMRSSEDERRLKRLAEAAQLIHLEVAEDLRRSLTEGSR